MDVAALDCDLDEVFDDLFCFDERAIFVKAFCDEGGKHAQARVITACGLLMSEDTCRELQRRWFKEAARAPRIPLPFHMSDCVSGSKAYRDLRDAEDVRVEMQHRMIATLRGLDAQAYGASLLRKDYMELASELQPNPAVRDPWFFVFQGVLLQLLARSEARGKKHPITVIFDRQDEFGPTALKLFNEMLTRDDLDGIARLKSLTFTAKDDVAALQAVDVITYEVNRSLSEQDEFRDAAVLRPQIQAIRECIEVEGNVWNKEALRELINWNALERKGELNGGD